MAGIYNLYRIGQMMRSHEFGRPFTNIRGGQWLGPCQTMGNRAHGDASSAYWNPVDPTLKSVFWNVLIPWGVIFTEADGVTNANINQARNTRVIVRNVKCWMRRTNGWQQMSNDNAPGGDSFDNTALGLPRTATMRPEDGGTAVLPDPSGQLIWHYYPTAVSIPDPWNVTGVMTTCEARLAVDNPALPDDRNVARYLMQIGADWYPGYDSSGVLIGGGHPRVNTGFMPNCALSGCWRPTNDWQIFGMNTYWDGSRPGFEPLPPTLYTDTLLAADHPVDFANSTPIGGVVADPPTVPATPALARPNVGSWEPKTSGATNNWFTSGTSSVSTIARRTRRRLLRES